MESTNNSSSQKNKEPESSKTKTMKNINAGRRFSDEQVKSLESIFKVESKLDPRRKFELATDLGLDPRQVAIWFQNKRARWRSKQLEQEYKELRANYDSLHVRFDHLKREKQSLLMQLHELHDLAKNLDAVDLTNDENAFKKSSNGGIDDDADDVRHENIIMDTEKTEEHELVSYINGEGETILSHLAIASPEQKWCDFSSWWES